MYLSYYFWYELKILVRQCTSEPNPTPPGFHGSDLLTPTPPQDPKEVRKRRLGCYLALGVICSVRLEKELRAFTFIQGCRRHLSVR